MHRAQMVLLLCVVSTEDLSDRGSSEFSIFPLIFCLFVIIPKVFSNIYLFKLSMLIVVFLCSSCLQSVLCVSNFPNRPYSLRAPKTFNYLFLILIVSYLLFKFSVKHPCYSHFMFMVSSASICKSTFPLIQVSSSSF